MADSNNIIRPLPQRVWQIAPASSDPPSPASPAEEAQEAEKESNNISPSRTRSILNLTSSTLFGIYSPSSPDGGYSQGNTPWATGSMTPQTPAYSSQAFFEDQSSPTIGAFERPQLRPTPHRPRHKPLFSGKVVPLALRSTLLFLSGVVYGVMVTYLHENETLTPVKLEGVHRHTWQYLLFWGSASVIMGNMLPWLDVLFEETSSTDKAVNGPRPRTNKMNAENRRQANAESGTGANVSADWFPAVRGIGVFIGIAYAIQHWKEASILE
ncbi:MAG: hypothetical protein LQ340_002906 [Diploschistes diacapsis]|nr:MAG: hypothetical protein LQ340_002906 [Diploschistes diacapsis]